MSNARSPLIIPSDDSDAPLPPYLQRHLDLGFNQEDVAALLSSINSSQNTSTTSTLAHLPAELLLYILEYVPVGHVLDWRLVCRGFRDAIDGSIAYHHLRRTELIGYMGARYSRTMDPLTDEQYENIRLLHAHFQYIEQPSEEPSGTQESKPVWSGTHAIFEINEAWYQKFTQISGFKAGDTFEDTDTQWLNTLHRLELRRTEEGFGTLRWCIRLDEAVLDLDFPLEKGRHHFDVDVNLHTGKIRVAWKDMLLQFLKTERALRRLIDEKRHSEFTFNHIEDCLRAVRRGRLHASLDPDDKVDRHIKWSLRLLHPLFGLPRHDPHMTLEDVENDATATLLLLRREASMSAQQIAYLHYLAADYAAMNTELSELDEAFGEFKTYMSVSGFQMNILMPAMLQGRIARNPIAWTDELRAKVELQVQRWKGQKKNIETMKELLQASNTALALPEDSFDELGSDF